MNTPNRRVVTPKRTSSGSSGARQSAPARIRKETSAQRSASSWLVLEAKKKPLRECGVCGAVFFDGHWHRLKSRAPLVWAKREGKVLLGTCEACRIEREAHGPVGAAGEVRIGAVPEPLRRDVLRTIANVGRVAVSRDPEERIISIDEVGRGYLVTTTENQLAVRIGKKLDSAWKGGKLLIRYSEEDMPITVRWTPPAGE